MKLFKKKPSKDPELKAMEKMLEEFDTLERYQNAFKRQRYSKIIGFRPQGKEQEDVPDHD